MEMITLINGIDYRKGDVMITDKIYIKKDILKRIYKKEYIRTSFFLFLFKKQKP